MANLPGDPTPEGPPVRIRSITAAVAVLPALVLSLAAHADVSDPETCRPFDATDPDSPELCRVDTYLQCPDDDAEKVRHPAIEPVVPLEYDAPTRSVQEGAGCGQLDEPVFGGPQMNSLYEFNWAGFVDGGIDTATFDIWVLGPGTGQLGETIDLDVRFVIDGESVFGDETIVDVAGEVSTSPSRQRVTAEVLPSDTFASVLLRFSATDIAAFLGPDVLEDADRHVEFTVNYPHTGDCAAPPPNGAERCAPAGVYPFVWGSTEVPAGISYNRTADLGTTVPAGEDGTA